MREWEINRMCKSISKGKEYLLHLNYLDTYSNMLEIYILKDNLKYVWFIIQSDCFGILSWILQKKYQIYSASVLYNTKCELSKLVNHRRQKTGSTQVSNISPYTTVQTEASYPLSKLMCLSAPRNWWCPFLVHPSCDGINSTHFLFSLPSQTPRTSYSIPSLVGHQVLHHLNLTICLEQILFVVVSNCRCDLVWLRDECPWKQSYWYFRTQ